ncbi:MAG: T9SS type A sorting domain-containing protein [Bacteroidetes bacterium]|nr:T9SS type A sorting domain-containing protein [Bacteroidota bacterium]
MKNQKILYTLSAAVLLSLAAAGQTFNTTGSWNTGSNWSTSSVPSGTGTDVTLAANPTVQNGNSDLIGNVTVNNNVTLTIAAGGTLTLGSSALFNASTKKSMTFSNNGTLQINGGGTDGLLEIWGDLIVNNNLQMQVTGNLIVHGNIVMNNNAQLQVSGGGTITVGGNVSGGNNAQIQVSGSGSAFNIGGSLSLSNGGQIQTSGGGTITAASCSCSGCSAQCSSVMPVILVSFEALVEVNSVKLNWTTAAELNFDYFLLERSGDGKMFNEIAQVKGHGTTNEMHRYFYEDNEPIIGLSYYRLTSNDFDGYKETFKVVPIVYHGEKQFRLSPNPSDGSSVKLNFNFDNDVDAQVTIYDNLGSLIGTYHVSGAGSINFDNALRSGVYLAKYTSAAFTKTERFLVK